MTKTALLEKGRLRARLLLLVLIFVGYSLCGAVSQGPAYLKDEIGYLVNAAFISGHAIDGASSYHSGYSIFLSPLFLIFDDPTQIWHGVMLLNACAWVLTFHTLFKIVDKLIPGLNQWNSVGALALVAMYPGWTAMAGYAFSQSFFVLVYVLSLNSLLNQRSETVSSALTHSFLVGFLYWIHPIGLAVAVASIVAVGIDAIKKTAYGKLTFHIFVVLCLVLSYQFVVQPWMLSAMTPPGYAPLTHYPSPAGLLHRIGSLAFWRDLSLVVFGQISYLLAATFGLAAFGCWDLANRAGIGSGNASAMQRYGALMQRSSPCIYMLLSLAGVVAMGALLFASSGENSVDIWIYGRYAEGVLIPLLALGAVSMWQRKVLLMTVPFVIMTGLLLQTYAVVFPFNNLVNIPGLWARVIYPDVSYAVWFLISAIGMLLVTVIKRPAAAIGIAVLFALCSLQQFRWHQNIFNGYSKPSGFVEFIKINYSNATCVGFDYDSIENLDLYSKERFDVYKYYLFNRGYRRFSVEDWHSSCNGPLLTYDSTVFGRYGGLKLAGREEQSKLMLVVKDEGQNFVIPKYRSDRSTTDWLLNSGAKVFATDALELANFSQVGTTNAGMIRSTGRSGYLIYGPYRRIGPGRYRAVMNMTISRAENVTVEVVGKQGNKIYHQHTIKNTQLLSDKPFNFVFTLDEWVADFELRIFVTANDDLAISGYQIVKDE